MISPSECFTGPIRAATTLTLLLPRSPYEDRVLVCPNDGEVQSVIVDAHGERAFLNLTSFDRTDGEGLHIPNVRIELDETSLFDLDAHHPPVGSMVRKSDGLFLIASSGISRIGGMGNPVLVMSGLPQCGQGRGACFVKWDIVLGQGDNKRALHSVDVSKK